MTPTHGPFLTACGRVVGDEHVITDPMGIAPWGRTVLHVGTRPLAVALPATTGEVQEIVRLAGRCGVRLHTISRGRNWGYGDACAPMAGCLILDLSRMDTIHRVDESLGFAEIEPGVGQGQLAERLAELGGEWIADCTGAGPEASVLGNLADRGFGHSMYGDRFANACSFEVVLADGSVHRTGFAGTRAAGVYKWGIGPSLDGLFTQSNLGIITRATVWLMPRPRHSALALIASHDPAAVLPLLDALRQLRLEGVVTSTVHMFNRMRLLGSVASFPYHVADGSRALEEAHPDVLAGMLRSHGIPAWVASASLIGPPAMVRAAVATLRSRLREHRFRGRIHLLTAGRLAMARSLGRLLPSWAGGKALQGLIGKSEVLWSIHQGRPDQRSVGNGSWRAKRPPDGAGEPRDGSAGMIWLSPVLPATREAFIEVDTLSRRLLHRHGFEHQVTYSFVTPRALCAVISISFDREDEGQRQRAGECHDALLEALLEAGYCPYRASPPTAQRLWRHPVAPWELLGRLRRSLDPTAVLSPGRYLP